MRLRVLALSLKDRLWKVISWVDRARREPLGRLGSSPKLLRESGRFRNSCSCCKWTGCNIPVTRLASSSARSCIA